MRACFFSGKFDTLFFAQTFLDLIYKPICNFGGSYFPAILSCIGFLWIQFSCFFIFFAFHLSQLPPFWCIVVLLLIFINSHIIQQIFHGLEMECRMGILNKNSTCVCNFDQWENWHPKKLIVAKINTWWYILSIKFKPWFLSLKNALHVFCWNATNMLGTSEGVWS
jgi:hypothetical protein